MVDRFCVFGAAPDTSNLGVSALMESTVLGLHGHRPGAEVTVFDYGLGSRESELSVGASTVAVRLLGTRLTKRLHRPESLLTIRALSRAGHRANPVLRRLRAADRIFDISGGDSFSDLYGAAVFREIALHKQIALSTGRPLVLLPQTYGPFAGARARRTAGSIVRRAEQVWARDERSFEVVTGLLGDEFDPGRHRVGVDVAFALPAAPVDPGGPFAPLTAWLADRDEGPLVGLNVSGMLWLDRDGGRRFGLSVDYRAMTTSFVERVVDAGARVVLVPHVTAPAGHPQSDHEASERLRAALDPAVAERVAVAGRPRTAAEAKGLIARFDWFSGARMHATIAALGSGVPVAGVAYSPKMAGVFARCGRGDHVVDARSLSSAEAIERLWTSFERREADREPLVDGVRPVVEEAHAQFATMVGDPLPSDASTRAAG